MWGLRDKKGGVVGGCHTRGIWAFQGLSWPLWSWRELAGGIREEDLLLEEQRPRWGSVGQDTGLELVQGQGASR